MSKQIKLTVHQWTALKEQLAIDNPPSVMLIRSKMKSKLGFTERNMSVWVHANNRRGGWSNRCVMLDFFSERKRTFFLLKYSEYIQQISGTPNV